MATMFLIHPSGDRGKRSLATDGRRGEGTEIQGDIWNGSSMRRPPAISLRKGCKKGPVNNLWNVLHRLGPIQNWIILQ